MKILSIILAVFVAIPAYADQVRAFGAVDGDTIIIGERCSRWDGANMRVRIYGIDTPESRIPPAKCQAEVKRGKAAKSYAQSLIKRGDLIKFEYVTKDKYACRVVGTVTLPDGRDFAQAMIDAGHARLYGKDGNLTKSDWCK